MIEAVSAAIGGSGEVTKIVLEAADCGVGLVDPSRLEHAIVGAASAGQVLYVHSALALTLTMTATVGFL